MCRFQIFPSRFRIGGRSAKRNSPKSRAKKKLDGERQKVSVNWQDDAGFIKDACFRGMRVENLRLFSLRAFADVEGRPNHCHMVEEADAVAI